MSQLAYGGGADEDVETMMNFAAEGGPDDAGEDWVATHTSKGKSHTPPRVFGESKANFQLILSYLLLTLIPI